MEKVKLSGNIRDSQSRAFQHRCGAEKLALINKLFENVASEGKTRRKQARKRS
jgi:hypothetical protein